MRAPHPLLVLVFAVAAAGAQAPLRDAIVAEAVPDRYGNGQCARAGKVDGSGRRQGHWDFWHANGRRAGWGSYLDGQRCGEWTFCDCYGRPVEREWPAARQANRQLVESKLPLTADDLRVTPCGDCTLGELLARWLRAAPEQRPELERMLRSAGPLAAAIAYRDLETTRADAQQLLELLARLPLPDDQPVELLQSLRFDALLGDAAAAVLAHWSSQFAGEWEGLLASNSSSRYSDLARLGAKAYCVMPALVREVCELDNPDHVYAPQYAIASITGPHIDRTVWLRELREASLERRVHAITMLAAKPGQVDAVTIDRLLRDAHPRIAQLARGLLADIGPRVDKYDDFLDLLATLPDHRLQANVADRLLVLGRRAPAIEVLRRLVTSDRGRANLCGREQLTAIAVEHGWIAPPTTPAKAPLPSHDEVAAMLQDPQRRELGWSHVRTMSMREFDPTPFAGVPADVMAAWLDLDPARVRSLVDELRTATPSRRAEIGQSLARVPFDAKQLAAVIASWPRAANGRFDCPPDFWGLEPHLRGADPVVAARLRVERLLAHGQPLGGPGRGGRLPPSVEPFGEPFDEGFAQVVDEFLRSQDTQLVASATLILAQMGPAARACLGTLWERLPALSFESLTRVQAIVAAADESQLPAFCLRLLDDPRVEARRVALWIAQPPSRPFAANESLARRALASVIADHQASNWFVHLEDGISWLPRLADALRANPTHALTQTIATFGEAARDTLQAAYERGTSCAAPELAKLLPATPAEQRRLVAAWLDPTAPQHGLAQNWLSRPGLTLSDAVARSTLLEALPRLAATQRQAIVQLLLAPRHEGPDTDELALDVACRPGWTFHHRPQRWQRLWRLADPSQREAVLLAASRAVPRPDEPPLGLVEAMTAHLPEVRDEQQFLYELSRYDTCPRIELLALDQHRSWNRGLQDRYWSSVTLAGRIESWGEGRGRDVFTRMLRRDPAATARTAVSMLRTERWLPALEVLRWLGPAAAPVLPDLTGYLTDDWHTRRCMVLQTLVAIHGGIEPAHAGLRAQFGSSLETVLAERFGSVEAYQLLEACRPGAGVELAARELRAGRGAALVWMSADPEVASQMVGELRAILRGGDRCLQCYSLNWLTAMGPAVASLLPDIDALAAVPACHGNARAAQRVLRGETPRAR